MDVAPVRGGLDTADEIRRETYGASRRTISTHSPSARQRGLGFQRRCRQGREEELYDLAATCRGSNCCSRDKVEAEIAAIIAESRGSAVSSPAACIREHPRDLRLCLFRRPGARLPWKRRSSACMS